MIFESIFGILNRKMKEIFGERSFMSKRKKQKSKLSRLGACFMLIVLVGFIVLIYNGKQNLDAQKEQLAKEKMAIEKAIELEEKRSQELEDYAKYIKSNEFIEKKAKEKFGLLHENEILLKPR